MNSSVASCPAAPTMEAAPPGCPSRNFVPSYTSPLRTNHGSFSSSCLLTSSIVRSLFTSALVIAISWTGSGGTLSPAASPPILSPQYPFARLPPSFLTLSIHPPGISAGWVGCSNLSSSPSRCITTLYQGLFIMPSTDQYMSLGWTIIASSMARTITSPAHVSSSRKSATGTSRDQKHQQKHVSRQPISNLPPNSVSPSGARRYSSSG